jgi:L-iditol 2-dehydrogenase
LGAGFLGQVLARVLKKVARHYQVHLLDRNDFKLKLGKKYSIEQYLNFKKSENLYLLKNLNSKFDIVIETTGNSEFFKNAILFSKKEGKILYSGNINRDLIFKKKEVSEVLRKQIIIKGVWNSSFKSKNNDWSEAYSFLIKEKIFEELITHVSNLENSAKLLDLINEIKIGKKKNNYIKGLIKIQ